MKKSALVRMFALMILVGIIGCDNRDGHCSAYNDTRVKEDSNDTRVKEDSKLLRDNVPDLNGGIMITDVVLQESEGGYYTDNKFMCNVHSHEDCELWLEVCDAKDGHRYSEIHDESWTRCVVKMSDGSNSVYDVQMVVCGDGEKVESKVTLCGKTISGEAVFVLFKTNAVLGTWKGR